MASAYAKRFKKIGKTIETNVEAGHRLVALKVHQTVVLATPVKTGRARSNWQVQAMSPNTKVREAYFPGKEGETGGQNAQAAIAAGVAVVNKTRANEIWISNGLAYIKKLNEGSSAQAPAGYVEQSVNAGMREAERIRALKGV